MREGIARHKTAISRTELSRPIKLALADGLLTQDRVLFDYGCGLGDDLRLLTALGFQGAGWDPVHRPDQAPRRAPVVNLGYVVNVIEDPRERQETLRCAWSLAEQVLIVSARLTLDGRYLGDAQDYADGLLTSRGTFQKFFDQQELRNWIDQTLETAAVPAALGIFYVFETRQHALLLSPPSSDGVSPCPALPGLLPFTLSIKSFCNRSWISPTTAAGCRPAMNSPARWKFAPCLDQYARHFG